jgi:lyso-ornithine lipid O-acyltransferase
VALGANLRLARKLVSAVVVTIVFLPVQLVALWLKLPLRSTLPVAWHKLMCRIMGIKVVVHGQAATARPLLIVSNHISWSDISVLSSVMPLSFVAKSEVRDWPVFGTLAKLQRTIFINRDIRQQTGIQAREIAVRLGIDNDVMVLFAEGTTGDGTRLLPFKPALTGAAALSINAGGNANVQPVALAYTRYGGIPVGFKRRLQAAWVGDLDLLPHLKHILSGQPIDVEVSFGEPIIIAPPVNRKAVTEACEASIGMMVREAFSGRVETQASNP